MDDVVHGDCDERFDGVRAALADNIASGEEVGACIAVDVDGETFVDIWRGPTRGPTTPSSTYGPPPRLSPAWPG